MRPTPAPELSGGHRPGHSQGHRRHHIHHPRTVQRGFTLIEAVMVIVLTGIVLAVASSFMAAPVHAFLSLSARSQLSNTADGALRRIGRELRLALPNSARVSANGLALEFIPSTGAARYSVDGSDPLSFGTLDTSFALVGPPLTLTANQDLVFYNLGSGITGSDAYAPNGSAIEQASANRRSSSQAAGSASTITLNSLAGLPATNLAAPYRVIAVSPPVTYRCDLAAGTLTRYTDYGFLSAQPDPPSGGRSALVASGVTACRFSADAAVVAARAGLVQLQLQLSADTLAGPETVSLWQGIHVDNLP